MNESLADYRFYSPLTLPIISTFILESMKIP
jgi:hypothetical protein